MKATRIAVLTALGLSLAGGAHAQPVSCKENPDAAECGWFWGFMEEPEKEEKPEELPIPILPEPKESEQEPEEEKDKDPCEDPETWSAEECGFVDPGKSFEFQSQQRDALLKRAVMSPNDPEAVRGFQQYMNWAVDGALNMSRTWEWNMMQDQELNPFVQNPVSAYGLRAASRVEDEHRDDVMEEIERQGGFLVWFTRNSCQHCHDMQKPLGFLKERTGLEIWNAPLDGECMDGYEDQCEPGAITVEGARHLGIQAVPDLWLHLPKDDLWFRVSSGVEPAGKIAGRVEHFFGAVQKAAKKGLDNAKNAPGPAVDFSEDDLIEGSDGGLAPVDGVPGTEQ